MLLVCSFCVFVFVKMVLVESLLVKIIIVLGIFEWVLFDDVSMFVFMWLSVWNV